MKVVKFHYCMLCEALIRYVIGIHLILEHRNVCSVKRQLLVKMATLGKFLHVQGTISLHLKTLSETVGSMLFLN